MYLIGCVTNVKNITVKNITIKYITIKYITTINIIAKLLAYNILTLKNNLKYEFEENNFNWVEGIRLVG